MYETLKEVAPDPIMQLAAMYREDTRTDKLDLGIGVYKDLEGRVPVLESLKAAQLSVIHDEATKNYVGLTGYEPFNTAMLRLVLGKDYDKERARALQATGGQGAVRLLSDLVRVATPAVTVWISDPSWANHAATMDTLGLKRRSYRYYDPATGAVDFPGMITSLREAKRGDVVILHASCHNPTGADLTLPQWREIARLANEIGFIPFADAAYQGLANGIDLDVAGVRLLASQVPEMLIAVSCSKNFTVYRDRVGCAIFLAPSAKQADTARLHLMALARVNYSMPPHHGAASVCHVLEDDRLRALWENELDHIRTSMGRSRAQLVSALKLRTNSSRFDFIAPHNGMFSLLGLSTEEVATLRVKFGIFLLPNSRINIAGLGQSQAERFADAVAAVTKAA